MYYISYTTKQEQNTEREKQDEKKESQIKKRSWRKWIYHKREKEKNNLMRNTYMKKGE